MASNPRLSPITRLFWAGLIFVALAAGAGIVREATRALPEMASSPHTAVQRPDALGEPSGAGHPASVLQRPRIATPAQGAAPPREWTWRLAGSVIGPGRREAFFTRGTEKRTVSEGEKIDGWILSKVDAASVKLTGPDGERTLTPQRDAAVVAAAETDQRIRAGQRDRRRDAQRTETVMHQLTEAMMASQAAETTLNRRSKP